jgi:crotonobetainyl-CoA:carnitine CoA-transferase CaiB-like acyl-CoA transferase
MTGANLVTGIALALLHRKETGEGQLVDVSLLRAGVWAMSHVMTAHAANNPFAAGPAPTIRGSTEIGERRSMITDGSFKCADDRWIMMLGAKNVSLLHHFIVKPIVLPKQARDKHRESTQKRDVFFRRRREPCPLEENDSSAWSGGFIAPGVGGCVEESRLAESGRDCRRTIR